MAKARSTAKRGRITHDIRVEVVPKAIQGASHELQLVKGPGAPNAFKLSGAELVVGRSPDVDLVLDSNDLSRRHARMSFAQAQWSIRDLDSRNGVYLNGVRIHSATLYDGDTVQLGNVVFVFREVRA